jgi:predicted Zn finger-like uncharacterized protein
MRLVCPNCGAQYDVPLEVIPAEGRDVQCSNCAHSWFQAHPDSAPPAQAQPEVAAPAEDELISAAAPEDTPAPAPASEPAEIAEADDDLPPPMPATAPPRRTIDAEMADLFREEREFEARQREADTLETQPDLGLQSPAYEDEVARRSREARERMAQVRGETPPDETALQPAPRRPEPAVPPAAEPVADPDQDAAISAAAAAVGSRRDLLPDVEEINQTLRASSEPRVENISDHGYPEERDPRRGGFSKGLLTMIGLSGIGAALYAFSTELGTAVPALAPMMESFVAIVDQGRVWLDVQVTQLLLSLDGMASEPAPEAPPSDNNS